MSSHKGMSFAGGDQSAPSPRPRQLRVLIADDDRDTVRTLMMVLRHEGNEVRGVYDGPAVISAMEDFQPHAAIVDVNMPGLSGYDVARRVRSKRGGERLLLVAISGIYKQGADRFMAHAAGFDHYLTKPYETSDVLKLLAPLRNPSR